jgi:putative ABC transport system permease protein
MKFFGLIWSQLWRKPKRTSFTLIAVAVAFLIFAVLKGFNVVLDSALDKLDNRLFVTSKFAQEPLPLGYLNRIADTAGVIDVAHMTFFGGYYQDKRNGLPVFAVEPDKFFAVYRSLFKVDAQQLKTMQLTRTGAIVAKSLAERFGWKVGDKVVLGTSIWTRRNGSGQYDFDIVGTFESNDGSTQGLSGAFFINYAYLNEARAFARDTVQMFIAGIVDPARATSLSQAIDAKFQNSPAETRTMTEQMLLQSQLSTLTDLNGLLNAIVGAAFFSILFVTGSTMTQSVRERLPEFAVLKTFGYTNRSIAAMVLAEAGLLCGAAALLGLLGARGVFAISGDLMAKAGLPLMVTLAALVIATALAVVSGGLPALRVGRMTIIAALTPGK